MHFFSLWVGCYFMTLFSICCFFRRLVCRFFCCHFYGAASSALSKYASQNHDYKKTFTLFSSLFCTLKYQINHVFFLVWTVECNAETQSVIRCHLFSALFCDSTRWWDAVCVILSIQQDQVENKFHFLLVSCSKNNASFNQESVAQSCCIACNFR